MGNDTNACKTKSYQKQVSKLLTHIYFNMSSGCCPAAIKTPSWQHSQAHSPVPIYLFKAMHQDHQI
jgi:hypothetical protein